MIVDFIDAVDFVNIQRQGEGKEGSKPHYWVAVEGTSRGGTGKCCASFDLLKVLIFHPGMLSLI